jgi:hypothetical protein
MHACGSATLSSRVVLYTWSRCHFGLLPRYALRFRTDGDPYHSLVHRSVKAYAEQMASGSDPAEDEVP